MIGQRLESARERLGLRWQSALPRRSAAQTGAATPLSPARGAIEQMKIIVRIKTVLKSPHSRRWRDQRMPQPTRSVWSAACLPPLSSARHATEQIKPLARSKAACTDCCRDSRRTPKPRGIVHLALKIGYSFARTPLVSRIRNILHNSLRCRAPDPVG